MLHSAMDVLYLWGLKTVKITAQSVNIDICNADAYKMEEGSFMDTLHFAVINSNVLSILTILGLSEVNAPVGAAAGSCCAPGRRPVPGVIFGIFFFQKTSSYKLYN